MSHIQKHGDELNEHSWNHTQYFNGEDKLLLKNRKRRNGGRFQDPMIGNDKKVINERNLPYESQFVQNSKINGRRHNVVQSNSETDRSEALDSTGSESSTSSTSTDVDKLKSLPVTLNTSDISSSSDELDGELWHQYIEILKRHIADAFLERGIIDQFERDVTLWKKTLNIERPFTMAKNRIGILKRIFIMLRYSCVLYRSEDSYEWKKWAETNWPIAALLSHGGRIIIQLPPEDDKSHGMWKWLVTGEEDGDLSQMISVKRSGQDAYVEGKIIFKRLGATHSLVAASPSTVTSYMTLLDNLENNIPTRTKRSTSTDSNRWGWVRNFVNGKTEETPEDLRQSPDGFLIPIPNTPYKKVVKEMKTWGISMRDSKYFTNNESYLYKHHRHWGMNIALGGEGNMSLSRKMIHANGSHGHVYFYYQSPHEDRYGAIMIGVEGSEYGCYDATGCFHGLSAKSPVLSPTFGYKWFAKKEPNLLEHKGPGKYNSMLIDLTTTGWKYLMEKQWRDDIPGESSEG